MDIAVGMRAPSNWAVCALVVVVGLSAGCGTKDEIASYKIRRSQSSVSMSDPMSTSAERGPQRMIAGIVQLDREAWFFKVMGSKDNVDQVQADVREFLKSLSFQGGDLPEWKLPDGWQKTDKTSSMGRVATLKIGDFDPPLEMSISLLGGQQDLLGNIHRWQGQLGIPPAEDLSEVLQELDYANGTMVIFDASGAVGNPNAMGASGKSRPKQPSKGGGSSSDVPIVAESFPKVQFDVPEGWTHQKGAPVVEAKLIRDGDEPLSISLTRMPLSFDDWEKNVTQWASDLSIELPEESIAERTQEIEVDGVMARKIIIADKVAESKKDSIAGVLMVKDGFCWFVKMKGIRQSVVENESGFDEFVKSIRIEK